MKHSLQGRKVKLKKKPTLKLKIIVTEVTLTSYLKETEYVSHYLLLTRIQKPLSFFPILFYPNQ